MKFRNLMSVANKRKEIDFTPVKKKKKKKKKLHLHIFVFPFPFAKEKDPSPLLFFIIGKSKLTSIYPPKKRNLIYSSSDQNTCSVHKNSFLPKRSYEMSAISRTHLKPGVAISNGSVERYPNDKVLSMQCVDS